MAGVVLSIVVAHLFPGKYHRNLVYGFLVTGFFFDAVSLLIYAHNSLTGKRASGFPLLGLACYIWFVLASRFSLLAPNETSFPRVLMFKGLDLVVLAAFHSLCHLPGFFWFRNRKV